MIKDIIIHDRTAPGPNTPDHPQALVPLPKTPAAVTALPAIVRREGILLNPALSVQGGRHTIARGQDSGNLRPAGSSAA